VYGVEITSGDINSKFHKHGFRRLEVLSGDSLSVSHTAK
jgi:hypothetical protein